MFSKPCALGKGRQGYLIRVPCIQAHAWPRGRREMLNPYEMEQSLCGSQDLYLCAATAAERDEWAHHLQPTCGNLVTWESGYAKETPGGMEPRGEVRLLCALQRLVWANLLRARYNFEVGSCRVVPTMRAKAAGRTQEGGVCPRGGAPAAPTFRLEYGATVHLCSDVTQRVGELLAARYSWPWCSSIKQVEALNKTALRFRAPPVAPPASYLHCAGS